MPPVKRKATNQYSTNRNTKKNLDARDNASGDTLELMKDKNAFNKYLSVQWKKAMGDLGHIINAEQDNKAREALTDALHVQVKNAATARR
jgi:hypothetical protein